MLAAAFAALWLAALACAIVGHRAMRRLDEACETTLLGTPERDRVCPRCAYPLAGLRENAPCPECGLHADCVAIRNPADRDDRLVVGIILAAIAAQAVV